MKIHIKGGRLIDPKSGVDAKKDVYIAAGKIVAIGEAPAGFTANRVIDAAGLVVCPGLVDLAARLREPGFEYMATLESEMEAAIAGGVTSLACPPDTDPPLDEPGLVEMLKFRAQNLNQARVYPVGALTQGLKGERLTEMAELVDAGCVAFSQADAPFADNQVFYHALQYAATFGFPVWLRPQDPALARHGVAHDGTVATRCGLPGIPVCAETVALSDHTDPRARDRGARAPRRLSSAEGVEMVRQAKRAGLPVTCDISIHHAHLTEMDIGYFDSNSRLDPPLRSQRDRDALRAALADGTVDAACSDHTPVDEDAKQLPFAEAEPGATGLELLLPLTLKWAEESGTALPAALARITSRAGAGARRRRRPPDPGTCRRYLRLRPRAPCGRSTPEALKSQGKNTPFIGLELKGKVRYTLVDGQVVYESCSVECLQC